MEDQKTLREKVMSGEITRHDQISSYSVEEQESVTCHGCGDMDPSIFRNGGTCDKCLNEWQIRNEAN